MNVITRKAEEKDFGSILKLLEAIGLLHYQGRSDIFLKNAAKYNHAQYLQILSDASKPIFVAEETSDWSILGYAFCQVLNKEECGVKHARKTLFIDDFCIDEGLRGRGVGKILFDAVTEYAKEMNCYNIELNVWEFNTGAVEFYNRMGMTTQRRIMEIEVKKKKDSSN